MSQPRPFFSSHEQGFTLIELIIVILLIGILSGVGGVRFFSDIGYRQRGAADDVASALRYAQKLAISSGCAVQVSIDGVANTYRLNQLSVDCTTGNFTREVFHPGTSATEYSNTIDAEVGLTSSVSPITFDARGVVTEGADVTVTVGSRNVEVIAATGLVQ
ncbi:MAG: GspH/FimT family protein [Candidatus Polarisedimenticolaceae bacterium]|nr:GspH/FimT family protein [Candidatus Polarisedimenticolaceae bacterium]